jgi:hypothetical protein
MSWHWSVSLVSWVPFTMTAAEPQAGDSPGGFVRRRRRGCRRCVPSTDRPWDLDHVDAEQGRAVVARNPADAAGQLLSLADPGVPEL